MISQIHKFEEIANKANPSESVEINYNEIVENIHKNGE